MSSDNSTTDILKRTDFINKLVNITDSILRDNGSAFIMIDGEWGVGKSFVIDKVIDELKENNEYFVVKYNCWTNSYYADPLLAIISTVIYTLEKETIWSSETKNKLNDTFQKLLSSISLQFLSPTGTGVSISYDFKDIRGNDDLILKNIAKLKDTLRNQTSKKVVILVDELDRCLPDYTIKTLERLHLLFKDVDNTVLIIANNNKQLDYSIKGIFGEDIDVEKYTKKFIDFRMMLSLKSQYFSKTKVDKKYEYYLDLFCNKSDLSYWDYFEHLIRIENARDRDSYIKKAYLIHNIVFGKENKIDVGMLLFELSLVFYGLNILRLFDGENKHNCNEFEEYLLSYINAVSTVAQLDLSFNDNAGYRCVIYLSQLKYSRKDKIFPSWFSVGDKLIEENIKNKIKLFSDYYSFIV